LRKKKKSNLRLDKISTIACLEFTFLIGATLQMNNGRIKFIFKGLKKALALETFIGLRKLIEFIKHLVNFILVSALSFFNIFQNKNSS
jgi:flagellar biosynthesis protein FlhB